MVQIGLAQLLDITPSSGACTLRLSPHVILKDATTAVVYRDAQERMHTLDCRRTRLRIEGEHAQRRAAGGGSGKRGKAKHRRIGTGVVAVGLTLDERAVVEVRVSTVH